MPRVRRGGTYCTSTDRLFNGAFTIIQKSIFCITNCEEASSLLHKEHGTLSLIYVIISVYKSQDAGRKRINYLSETAITSMISLFENAHLLKNSLWYTSLFGGDSHIVGQHVTVLLKSSGTPIFDLPVHKPTHLYFNSLTRAFLLFWSSQEFNLTIARSSSSLDISEGEESEVSPVFHLVLNHLCSITQWYSGIEETYPLYFKQRDEKKVRCVVKIVKRAKK